MTPPITARRFRIFVALDRSEYGEIVLEHALDQAARHDPADVHFVTCIGDHAAVEATRRWLATQVLQGLDAFGAGDLAAHTWLHVVVGDAAEEVTAVAADLRADLLVVGRFGTHSRKGSPADDMVAKATCPTLVVNLKDDTVGTPQCEACVAVREATNAEQLFCPEHATGHAMWSTSLISSWAGAPGGGLL